MLNLLENEIYGIEIVKVNRKCMPSLKADKRGEHDWRACTSFSSIEWMGNKFVILLSNCHDHTAVHYIKRRVKVSKDILKVSCPTVFMNITNTWVV